MSLIMDTFKTSGKNTTLFEIYLNISAQPSTSFVVMSSFPVAIVRFRDSIILYIFWTHGSITYLDSIYIGSTSSGVTLCLVQEMSIHVI